MTQEQYENMLKQHREIRRDLLSLSRDGKEYIDKIAQLEPMTIALKEYVANHSKEN